MSGMHYKCKLKRQGSKMSFNNTEGSGVKRGFIFLILSVVSLMAKEYYAKVEPYEIRTISSNVSGLVMYANEENEGRRLGKKNYIEIDDELDKIELEQSVEKLALLKNTLKLNEEIVENYAQMLKKKDINYNRVKDLKIKSTVEKDREFYDLAATRNQYISTRKEMENLKIQINDLELRQAQLGHSIRDKHLNASGYVLYRLMVKEGQVVNPSAPLAEIADISRAKLTIYLNAEDMKGIKEKVIYLDGQKSNYKINRLWNIADATHLSSYRAEIIIDAPKRFSILIKVEFRSE